MGCYGEDTSDISWKQKSERGNGFSDEWRQRSEDKSVTTIEHRAANSYLAALWLL
jgi:hypothetical protein